MESSLQNFFYPKSIAVVGASSKKGSIGYELTASILKYNYKGEIFLINPSSDFILGLQCYKNISLINKKIDLAIILVSKQFVEDSIKNAIDAGIKSFILITAGFRETGKEGKEAEQKILEMIKKAGARLVGPNCMGVINTLDNTKLNATFVAESPEKGSTAFLSQSGALGAAVLNSLRETNIKFAHFISVGNKADISENDLLKYWQKDDNVSTVCLYLESFSNGREFLELISEGEVKKPVILLKAGRTDAAIKAASSHTGALGSSDRSVDAVCDQFGILRVNTINELFNSAKGFEHFPFPKGNKTAVVTNAGGPAILTVDQLELNFLSLAELSSSTKEKLKGIVHPEGSINNPVDLLPGGTAEAYKNVIEVLLEDEDVDSVIVIFVEPVMVKPIEVVQNITSIISDKPVYTVVMPLPEFWENYKNQVSSSKPLFRNPEDPAVVIKNMLHYRNRDLNSPRLKKKKIDKLVLEGDGFLEQSLVNVISRKYKFPIVESKVIGIEKLSEITDGYPYVLKAGGKKIIHKSELKGVALDLNSRTELLDRAEKMLKSFSEQGIRLEYFLLQPYIKARFEMLIGAFRDPDFGPMVMFGTGGKYVEQYKDIAVKSCLLNEKDLDDIIDRTIMGKLLKGVRGEIKTDLLPVKETISSLAQLMLDYDEISEVDLNPVILDNNNKIFSVDIRIRVQK